MYVFAYVIDTSRTKVVAKAAGSGGRPGKEWCPVVPLQPPWESKGKDTNI